MVVASEWELRSVAAQPIHGASPSPRLELSPTRREPTRDNSDGREMIEKCCLASTYIDYRSAASVAGRFDRLSNYGVNSTSIRIVSTFRPSSRIAFWPSSEYSNSRNFAMSGISAMRPVALGLSGRGSCGS